MTRAHSPYMEWAKNRPAPAVDLAGSNLLACTLEDLPGGRDAVDVAGESPNGYAPLVSAIAERYGVRSENVASGVGCSGANFLALASLVDAGDEVLFEAPGYDPIAAAAEMLGARVTRFERRFEDGYRLDPGRIANALTARTRVIVFSNPHNPSGALASPEDVAEVGRLAEARGVMALADEVYLDLVAPDAPPPAATLSRAYVSTNSLTKAYGLSSLRCGWVLAAADVAESIRRARDVVDVSGPIPAERLSALAFRRLPDLAARAHGIVGRNAPLVSAFLASRPELEWVAPRATIAFPRFRDGRDASPFVRRLFEEHGVAVVPGSFFDAPSHFRIAFGGATTALERGLAAIRAVLDDSG